MMSSFSEFSIIVRILAQYFVLAILIMESL